MKLHRISVTNLNSLYGEHTVDLDQDLGGASLFLVMGPTGSGKSTLMDAISLALFGRTPRLRYPAKRGADQTTIVSRGAGHAKAVVDFSKRGPKGRERYRATWRVWRARQSPTGDMQTPRRQLEHWHDNEWTALHDDDEVRRKYQPVFDEVLEGFTVDLFQRSMLLAQGEFDAFLSARADERAEVLERLTETASYKKIGEKAARIQSAWKRQLKKLSHQLEGDGSLDPEERRRLEAQRDLLVLVVEGLEDAAGFAEVRQRWMQAEATDAAELAEATTSLNAAREAMDAAADSLGRLRRHERSEPVFDAMVEADHAQRGLERLREDLALQQARLPTLVTAAEQADQEAQSASAAFEATRAQHEALREVVEQWSQAQEREQAAAREQTQSRSSHQAAQDRVTLARTTTQDKRHRLEEAAARLTEALQRKPAHEVDARLFEALSSLEADARALSDQIEQVEVSRRSLRAQAASLEAERADHARREQAFADRRKATLAPVERAFKQALERREKLLDGELIPNRVQRRLEGEQSAADTRVQEIVHALGKIRLWATAMERRSQASAASEAARARVRDMRRTEEQLEAEQRRATATAISTREHHNRLVRIASLIEHRELLEDGEDCPLCGSPDHPLTRNVRQKEQDDLLRAELSDSRTSLQVAEQTLDGCRTQHARAVADVSHADKELAQARRDREEASGQAKLARTEAVDAARSPRLTLGREPEAAVVHAEQQLADAREHADQLRMRYRSLTDALAAHNTARDALKESSEAFDREQHGMERAAAAMLERQTAHTTQEESLAQREAEVALSCEEFAEQLTGLGLQVDNAGLPSQWMREVRDRVRLHGERVHTREQRQADRASAAAEVDQALALEEVAVRTAQEAATALESRAAAHREAVQATAHALDAVHRVWDGFDMARQPGTSPRALLARHHDRLDAERTRAAETTTAANGARTPVVETRARITTLETDQVEAEATARRLSQELQLLLAQHGLDLDQVRADRVPPNELVTLRATRDRLTGAISRAEVLVTDRQQRHTQRLAERPEHLGSVTIEELHELRQAIDVALDARRGELESTRQTIAIDDSHKDRREAISRRLRTTSDKARIWLRLHDLIGTGDGDAFKTFAQSLNLGRLLRQANHHLRRLSQRYRLVIETNEVGMPTLEFLVEDAWQQGAMRSPRTLSGGERFLVSLALALGLSDLRNVSMPIETLLLDEGFGTLDTDTLDVALAALQQLRSSGRQVGIISHVVGLHERVEARILIEPQGGGRSTVRAELG